MTNEQASFIKESLRQAQTGFMRASILRLNEFFDEKEKDYRASTVHLQAEKTWIAVGDALLAVKLLIDACSKATRRHHDALVEYKVLSEKVFSLNYSGDDTDIAERIAASQRNFVGGVENVRRVQQAGENLVDFWCLQALAAGWSIMDDEDHLSMRVLWEELYKSAVDMTAGALLLPEVHLGDLHVGPEVYVPIFRAVQACIQAYAKQSHGADEMLARWETLELRGRTWAEETTKLATLLNSLAAA